MAIAWVTRCSDLNRQPNWSSSGVTMRDRLAFGWASCRLGWTRSRCGRESVRTVRKHESFESKATAWWSGGIAARCSRRSRWFERRGVEVPPAGIGCGAERSPCGCANTANRPCPCRAHIAMCRCRRARPASYATIGYGPCPKCFKFQTERGKSKQLVSQIKIAFIAKRTINLLWLIDCNRFFPDQPSGSLDKIIINFTECF